MRWTRCCASTATRSPTARRVGARDPEEALALFDGIDGAIVASEPVTAEMLARATDLQIIARSGVGYDSIDVAAAAARGIRVCNTPGVNHDAVAELTIALMLDGRPAARRRHRRGAAGAVATRRRPRGARRHPRRPRLRAQRPRSGPAGGRVRDDRPGQHRPPRPERSRCGVRRPRHRDRCRGLPQPAHPSRAPPPGG